jgi:hypothetical protein
MNQHKSRIRSNQKSKRTKRIIFSREAIARIFKIFGIEKQNYKKDIEKIESFIFSAKNRTMTDIDNNRSELEALKQFS